MNKITIVKERNEIKKQFQEELEQQLGYKVYVLYRGREYDFIKPPHNLSLKSIKYGEKLFVYIYFRMYSTRFYGGFVISVKDVQNRKALFTKSWGTPERIETEIIDVKSMSYHPTRYPHAIFANDSITLTEFREEIVKRFMNLGDINSSVT